MRSCPGLIRFESDANAKFHYDTTGHEIFNDFKGPPGRRQNCAELPKPLHQGIYFKPRYEGLHDAISVAGFGSSGPCCQSSVYMYEAGAP